MTAAYLVAAFALIALNGFFVAAEFAIVRVRSSRLAQVGDRAGLRSAQQAGTLDVYLAAAQLGITLASIGLGFVGEPAFGHIFEGFLGDGGAAVVLGTILAFVTVTILHVVIGEQSPKAVAINHAEATTRWVSWPMGAFLIMFRPVILALNAAANAVVRLFGIAPPSEVEPTSRAEYPLLIEESLSHGQIDRDAAEMLVGVFALDERQAREVMTPRPDVASAPSSATVREVAGVSAAQGHSRIPLLDGDHVVGVVHVADLAARALDTPDRPAAELARTAHVVPETKRLDRLLGELRTERSTMAVIVDEYGDVAGIVTMEDIVEEIVGEIYDETDVDSSSLRKVSDELWVTDGRATLNDLADAGIAVHATDRPYSTVGGLILDGLGRLPARGDAVQDGGYEWLVDEVRGTRIGRVRIRPLTPPPPEAGATAA